MKVNCTRGFGIVEHPETGEKINVEEPFETDRETFELLNDAYPGFEVVDDSDTTEGDESEDTDNAEDYPTNEDGEPLCVGKDDGQCSRVVEEPGGNCWQHGD